MLSGYDFTGNWIQIRSQNGNKLLPTCFHLSRGKMKCVVDQVSPRSGTYEYTFVVNGLSIRIDGSDAITGTYNGRDTITWDPERVHPYFFTTWNRVGVKGKYQFIYLSRFFPFKILIQMVNYHHKYKDKILFHHSLQLASNQAMATSKIMMGRPNMEMFVAISNNV